MTRSKKRRQYQPMANLVAPKSYQWDAPSIALHQWAEIEAMPQASSDPSIIDIYDVIGEDPWGDGFSEKKLAAILRERGANPVTLNINSPGGDMFAGLAMYNRLKAHNAEVTVNVMGVAASAASLIAMAGDKINMMTGSVLMIHNAWGMVIGNRHDFADASKVFATFDQSMAEIYAKRTGMSTEEIAALMDGESDGTFFTAAEAIAKGFADSEIEAPKANAALPLDVIARRKIEAALAKDGLTRKQRAQYIKNLTAARDAGGHVERDADDRELKAALSSLKEILTRS